MSNEKPVELTEAERSTYEAAFWANIATQANRGPNTDISWLCDEVADTVAQMIAARYGLLHRRVEALAERYEAMEREEGYGGELWSTTASAIRAALAEPERDATVADVKPDAMAAFEQTLREHKRVLDALAEYDAEPERDEEGGR